MKKKDRTQIIFNRTILEGYLHQTSLNRLGKSFALCSREGTTLQVRLSVRRLLICRFDQLGAINSKFDVQHVHMVAGCSALGFPTKIIFRI